MMHEHNQDDTEIVTSAIISIDSSGIIQSVDKSCCQLFGYNFEELIGQKVNILIPEPYNEQHDSYIEHYHRTGVKRVIDKSRIVEGKRKDGVIFPIKLSVSEIKGDRNFFVAMIHKLTDPSAIITCTWDGTILSCNSACKDIFGWTTQELCGKNVSKLIPPPHSNKHDSYLKQYQQTGKSNIIGKVRNVGALHKYGTVFPICLRVKKVDVGAMSLFRAQVDVINDEMEAVFTIDKDGIIENCNKNFTLPLFGYTSEELNGKHIKLLIPSLFPINPSLIENKNEVSSSSNTVGSSITNNNNNDKPNNENNTNNNNNNNNNMNINFYNDMNINFNNQQNNNQKTEMENNNSSSSNNTSNDNSNNDVNYDPLSSFIKLNKLNDTSTYKRMEARHKDNSVIYIILHLHKFKNKDGKVKYSGRIKRVQEETNKTNHTLENTQNNSSSIILIGSYYAGETIGKGTYGKVRIGKHKETGQRVAIKVLQKDVMDKSEIERTMREIKIMQSLDHPNICKLYNVVETEDRINIILEYVKGGELHSYVVNKVHLDEKEARVYFNQLICAIDYCHSRNIIHRDIKHKNILIHFPNKNNNNNNNNNTNDKEEAKYGEVKLIDFGLSNYTEFGHLRSTFCGTPAYAAPEMILAKKYVGPEVDIWSMGVVLFTMLVGKFPFKNIQDIIEGRYEIPSHLSKQCESLIKRMLTIDSKKRITLKEIQNDSWTLNSPSLLHLSSNFNNNNNNDYNNNNFNYNNNYNDNDNNNDSSDNNNNTSNTNNNYHNITNHYNSNNNNMNMNINNNNEIHQVECTIVDNNNMNMNNMNNMNMNNMNVSRKRENEEEIEYNKNKNRKTDNSYYLDNENGDNSSNINSNISSNNSNSNSNINVKEKRGFPQKTRNNNNNFNFNSTNISNTTNSNKHSFPLSNPRSPSLHLSFSPQQNLLDLPHNSNNNNSNNNSYINSNNSNNINMNDDNNSNNMNTNHNNMNNNNNRSNVVNNNDMNNNKRNEDFQQQYEKKIRNEVNISSTIPSVPISNSYLPPPDSQVYQHNKNKEMNENNFVTNNTNHYNNINNNFDDNDNYNTNKNGTPLFINNLYSEYQFSNNEDDNNTYIQQKNS